MANKKSEINISLFHLIVVGIVITATVIAASFWNQYRTQTKLSKMMVQSEKIYVAHQEEFVKAIKDNTRYSYTKFLNEVNAPEKGIYQIGILTKDDSGMYHLESSWAEGGLNADETSKLNQLLSSQHSVSTDTDLSLNTYNQKDNLFVFTPIKNKDVVIGFVVVSVRRNQNI